MYTHKQIYTVQKKVTIHQFYKTKKKRTKLPSDSPREKRLEDYSLSRVRLFATLWTVAHQASPSMGFSRQEYWSGLPFPSPGDLPDPGIELRSPTLQADAYVDKSSKPY